MNNFSYLDQLITDCMTAKNAMPIQSCLYTPDLVVPANSHAIYIISEIGGNPLETFERFNAFKTQFKDQKTPQPNHPAQILYVGSCTTSLHRRINQHLHHCPAGTHALRLYEWFTGRYQIEILFYAVNRAVLQLIEDNIADQLKPALGKRGSNNK